MTDDRAKELISAAADDALSEAEQEELGRLLADSPAAREFADDLKRIDALLADTPPEEPPAGLHARILQGLPARRPVKPAAKATSWWSVLFATPVVRYGLATTTGILLAVSVYESQRPVTRSMDISELVGTMAPGSVRASGSILGSHRFHAQGVESRVQLVRRGAALLLDIRVDAARPVDIAVDFSAAGMQLDALAQTNGAVESIRIADSILRVRVHGRRTLTALLQTAGRRKEPASIQFDFSSDDEHQTTEMTVPRW